MSADGKWEYDPAEDLVFRPIPVYGVPEQVAQWEPRTQVRWFARYTKRLWEMPLVENIEEPWFWDQWFVQSDQHKGWCCERCVGDDWHEWPEGPACCCKSQVWAMNGDAKVLAGG